VSAVEEPIEQAFGQHRIGEERVEVVWLPVRRQDRTARTPRGPRDIEPVLMNLVCYNCWPTPGSAGHLPATGR
jgi:hypothetical protein